MTPPDFDFIKRLMRRVTGNDLPLGKDYLVEGRLGPLAKKRGTDVAGLVATLRMSGTPALEREVAEALTTNETSFFRDLTFFRRLEQEVLPALIKTAGATKRLRIWCGAASTGQEPYSIAMVIDQILGASAEWKIELLATDYNETVLDHARSGLYTSLEVGRGLPGPLLLRYFDHEGESWRVKPVIKSRVQFDQLNLVDPWPSAASFDAIFLRNVLIYFDLNTRRDILTKVLGRLRSGGVFAIGRSETLHGVDDRFVPDGPGTGFFRKN